MSVKKHHETDIAENSTDNKSKWIDYINVANVGKGLWILLGGLGLVGGSMATYASTDPAASVSRELTHHVSLDSMRWCQMEKRVAALENMTDTMSREVKETNRVSRESNDILKREFGRRGE